MQTMQNLKQYINKHQLLFIVLFLVLALSISSAYATVSGGKFVWDDAMKKISDSFTGPLATAIALIGIFVAGCTLIFAGGDLSSGWKTVVYIVLFVCILQGASKIITSVGQGSGAVLDPTMLEQNIDYVISYLSK